ncbi:OmpA family protein [Aliikangiella sp. IMCC44359]|uniref:OmpA family protein n=1 Tax=Aliikangiella sp. IMCC44359 TaxID=3459125 RepID=UPI00403B0FB6
MRLTQSQLVVTSMLLTLGLPQSLSAQSIDTNAQDLELKNDISKSTSTIERGNWYISGNIGYAPGSSSIEELNQELNSQNILGQVTKVDNERYGWEFGIGYEIFDFLALELGYADLGEVEIYVNSTQSQLDSLFDAIEHVHPESGEGLTFSIVGDVDLNQNWKLIAKVGYFDWDSQYNTFNAHQGVGDDKSSDANLFYGIGTRYQINTSWDLSLEWKRYEFIHEESDFWSLGIVWYPFAKEKTSSQSQVKLVKKVQRSIPLSTPEKSSNIKKQTAQIIDQDKDGITDDLDYCFNTPIGTAVNLTGCPEIQKISLNIEFQTASDIVEKSFLHKIETVANYLKQQKTATVVIEGHTDDLGTEKFNLALSNKRANSVVNLLVDRFKISADRVKGIGYGESRPLINNTTPESRAKNRRVVAIIKDN